MTLMTRTDYPSLGYMLHHGEGTLWEHFDGSAHRYHCEQGKQAPVRHEPRTPRAVRCKAVAPCARRLRRSAAIARATIRIMAATFLRPSRLWVLCRTELCLAARS